MWTYDSSIYCISTSPGRNAPSGPDSRFFGAGTGEKMKKEQLSEYNLKLIKNIDILEYLSNHSENRPKLVIGFAAETENLLDNSLKKLKNKKCDWIIANDVSDKSIGFNSNNNEVTIIYKDQKIEKISKVAKSEIAIEIVNRIINSLEKSNVRNIN